MAYEISEGSGKTIAADSIDDKEYQHIKLFTGDGSNADRVDGDNPLPVSLHPVAGDGLSPIKFLDTDESQDEIKGSAGKLYRLDVWNEHASAKRYVKLYNAVTGDVTVGATVPVMTIPVAAGEELHLVFEGGLEFSAGICVAATTGLADNDAGAPGANEIIIAGAFK